MEKKFFCEIIEELFSLNEKIRSSEIVLDPDDLKKLECVCSILSTTARTRAFFASLKH